VGNVGQLVCRGKRSQRSEDESKGEFVEGGSRFDKMSSAGTQGCGDSGIEEWKLMEGLG